MLIKIIGLFRIQPGLCSLIHPPSPQLHASTTPASATRMPTKTQIVDAFIVLCSVLIIVVAIISAFAHLIVAICAPLYILLYVWRHLTAGPDKNFYGALVFCYRAIALPFRIVWWVLRLSWTLTRLYRFSQTSCLFGTSLVQGRACGKTWHSLPSLVHSSHYPLLCV